MTNPHASGADLARQALAAARAAAKNTPAPAGKKTRRTMRPHRGEQGDPQGLGAVLQKLTDQQGWSDGLGGGNLLDQWPQICPTELATTVQPAAYDPERGLLSLRPSSPAYATQLRLFQHTLVQHLNRALGRRAVRAIRILPPTAAAAPATDAIPQPATPEPAPAPARKPAPEGYKLARQLLEENRPERQPGNPYVAEADARQIAALRANREPETEHREAVWASEPAGPEPGSMEASEAAARAYARRTRRSTDLPRAFDVA
ncbi:DUF721 domain-containing protein [Streptomyces sp. AS02]|uniref:DUF721 domain-containing protein n=1 Tax=Streptomyces sp. AS02 TaxID=2938946 RepID=UPI0024C2C568|nr:DUF721 domain-containing protein [Streptomyces sp. AS02]